VNAAFLLVTTAWLAGADTGAPASAPAAPATSSCCGGCNDCCNSCCYDNCCESWWGRFRRFFHNDCCYDSCCSSGCGYSGCGYSHCNSCYSHNYSSCNSCYSSCNSCCNDCCDSCCDSLWGRMRRWFHRDCCDYGCGCNSCYSGCNSCGYSGTGSPTGGPEQIGSPKDAKPLPPAKKAAQLIPQPAPSSGLIIEQ
jgi:hypothetical protein